ncbi:MFS transporter [Halolamina sp. CBA1230]|uniref:MFS transporter n=1 Tax=Halolamina sp. CBA1230 TaxID=1853690 RepID=UPI0020D19D0C|nr:MFS transporter [Halolamina sp. CBA1230]
MSSRDRTALALVVWAVMLSQTLLYPGVDRLVAAMGLGSGNYLDASTWFLAAEFAAFALTAGVWGAASDTAGRRIPFVAAGAVLGALGYGVLALLGPTNPAMWLVLVVRFLQGAATVGAFSLAMSMLADLGEGNGRNMGAAGIAIGLGTALGAPLGGQLYSVGPFVPLWTGAALLTLVGAATLLVSDHAPEGDDEGLREALGALRRTPALAVPFAFGFADRMTAGFFALVGTVYFRTAFELSPAQTGITLALFFAPFGLLQYPFGRLSDQFGRTAPIVAGSALYGIVVLGIGAAEGAFPARGDALLAVQFGMVAVGVLGALMAPATMALVVDLAPTGERGVALGGFNIAGSLGFLAGVVGGGLIADDFGYPAAFAFAGGAEILLALVAIPAFLKLQISREKMFS